MRLVSRRTDVRERFAGSLMGISIAMCTYNGASYLRQQLDSIAAQSRLPDELVICDDGSTDGTLELLEAFARVAPFQTQIFRNAVNLGYSRNFANAVGRCSEEIIALCDQDDVWYPPKLEHIERRFQLDPSLDGVFSNGDLIDSNSRPTRRTLWESFLFRPDDQRRFNSGGGLDVLLQRNVVTGMAFAFRRRVRGLLASVPRSWIHDGWLAFLMAARSTLVADPERLVGYRVHGTQQIGAPASLPEKLRRVSTNGVNDYLKNLRERNLKEYERTAIQFTELAEFLRREGRHEERELIAKVEAKAAHALRGAAALSSGRLSRWPILVPHLRSYRHFSPNGARCLSRDFIV